MVKADVKTPNKRKSFGNDTPAKKSKIENGQNKEKTPQKPFTPKKTGQTPKNNQQISSPKSNKKNKPNQINSDSPKKIKAFAGTKQLDGEKQKKKSKQPKIEGDSQSAEKKKKRRNQYDKLIATVKAKPGSKDSDLLKQLEEKITDIKSRPELTKTAKRKLALLQKLKVICEEGTEAAAAKSKAKNAVEITEKKKKKAAAASVKVEEKPEDSDEEEDSDADDSDAEDESGEEEEDSDADDAAQNDDDEEDDDDDEEEEDDDDDSEEEAPAPKEKKEKPQGKAKAENVLRHKTEEKSKQNKIKKEVNLDELKTSKLVTKGQKRFVLFIGNIPYDTTKDDLKSHFAKAGDILHIRLPTEKGNNRPRGFGYVEVNDEITYQKCLSMHHSQIKGRRINVLYTQGGKKKGDEKKNEIKKKNMKLHGLRTQGKLAGSVKQTQKRSFRRKKSTEAKNKSDDKAD